MTARGGKRERKGGLPPEEGDRAGARFADNYNLSPEASKKLRSKEGRGDGVIHLDGGTMLTASEIIDFSEGTDSWTNNQ